MIPIINIRYEVRGLHFDVAVDYGKCLHAYTSAQNLMLPLELYCFDKPDWDIRMMFIPSNKGQIFEWAEVIKETEEWIDLMKEDEEA